MYGLVQLVPPAQEPISLDEAKRFLRVDLADDDDLIAGLITEARERAERVTERQLCSATWQLSMDYFPGAWGWGQVPDRDAYPSRPPWFDGVAIRFPRPPLQSVTSIVYIAPDLNNTPTLLDTSIYQVDTFSEPGRIAPAYGKIWPSTRLVFNGVVVVYTAGYGLPAQVPAGIRTAMKAALSHCYENRDKRDEEYLDRLFVPYYCGGGCS